MKIVLSLMLAVYSIAMGTYAASQIYSVQADCTAGCFNGETAFGSGTTRNVNVKYRETGPNGFTGANAEKVSGALTTAMNNWNTATDGTSTSPFHFQGSQGTAAGNVNVEVILVDELKGKSAREVCGRLETTKNRQTGQIESARLYIPKKVLEKSNQQDLSEVIQHELGHFMGLADFYGNADQCETIMAQAKEGCTQGAKGSQSISQNDVKNIKTYVNDSSACKQPRVATPIVGGGGSGFIDPQPIPFFYPRTCYYFYESIDIYEFCDCNQSGSPSGYRYVGTVYYLVDAFCNY